MLSSQVKKKIYLNQQYFVSLLLEALMSSCQSPILSDDIQMSIKLQYIWTTRNLKINMHIFTSS